VRITILGLGQIGGSIVLSLRKRKFPCHIKGIDPSRKRLDGLRHKLDEASTRWKNEKDSDLVILSLHFSQIMTFLKQAPKDLLILDVCSGKEKIVGYAKRRGLRFIGGHPLAGNERLGEKGWDPDLFSARPFFLCPTPQTTARDLSRVRQFVRKIDAHPIEVAPVLHDLHLAKTSHFAAILSLLFANLCKGAPKVFKGPGYNSMSRLSHTPPVLLETFLRCNRKNIVLSALQMRELLDRWIQRSKQKRSFDL
jgi:prephenate dehydrogenase